MSLIKKYVKTLRTIRACHRYLGLILLILVLVSSITGILLAWKKNVETLQPSTQKGISNELSTWKPIEEIAQIAQNELIKQYPEEANNSINRIDVRPSKGNAKVLF